MARPKGAKTIERLPADELPASCPACGSTRRERYEDHCRREPTSGQIEGRPYSAIIYRPTRCLDCGQRLTVRQYVFEPGEQEQ